MFERLSERARTLAERRAREAAARLAEAMADALPPGVRSARADEGVTLTGRGLRRRFALEPGLRWLMERLK